MFVFEAPIDLISFLCLFKKECKQSYLSLGGVGEKALLRFLSEPVRTSKPFTSALTAMKPGTTLAAALYKLMPEGYTVHRLIPLFQGLDRGLQTGQKSQTGSISGKLFTA